MTPTRAPGQMRSNILEKQFKDRGILAANRLYQLS